MKKSAIERQIEKRAEDRFDKEVNELALYINNHPIGKKLKITIGDEQITLAMFGHNRALINEAGTDNNNATKTNLVAIKVELLEKYEIEEVKNLENKLDSIRYIFEQGER